MLNKSQIKTSDVMTLGVTQRIRQKIAQLLAEQYDDREVSQEIYDALLQTQQAPANDMWDLYTNRYNKVGQGIDLMTVDTGNLRLAETA